MRIYIIDNDGITLCREAPATLSDDEVAVASKEQLHAAPLSGKRLRAITPAVMPPDIMYLRNAQHRELYLSGLRLAAGEAA